MSIYANGKAWGAIDSLTIIWKFDHSDKMKQIWLVDFYGILTLIKQNFINVVALPVLLFGRTTWTLTKPLDKKAA